MKKLSCLLSLIIPALCIQAQSPAKMPPLPYIQENYNRIKYIDGHTPTHLRNLKGNIRKLTQYDYEVAETQDSTPHKGNLIYGTSTSTLFFDKEKKITNEWYYRRTEGKPSSKVFYRDYKESKIDSLIFYTPEGTKEKGTYYTYDKDGVLIQEINIEKGKEDKAIEKIIYHGDTLITERKWGSREYYIHGRLVKRASENEFRIWNYKYAPSGALKEVITTAGHCQELIEQYNEDSLLIYRQSFDYRKDTTWGEEREWSLRYSGMDLIERRVKSIDAGTAEFEDFTSEYNDHLIIREYMDNLQSDTYSYNDHNDLVLHKIERPLDDEIRYQYKYDLNGNWIERIEYSKGKPIFIVSREIEYY